ncbi:hypothetical protein BS50DRAFT_484810, partial [Corynespora cassiicola Philippines]
METTSTGSCNQCDTSLTQIRLPSRKCAWHYLVSPPPQPRVRDGIGFFDLPAEIRNEIYRYSLGMNIEKVPRMPHIKRDDRFNLFQVCRLVYGEAATFLYNNGSSYIPIVCGMQIKTYWQFLLAEKDALMPHAATTQLVSVAAFRDFRLHLHVQHLIPPDSDLLLRPLQSVLEIMRSGRLELWGGARRKGTVHLDHFLAD